MDKEDVPKKAPRSQNDEKEMQSENQKYKLGWIGTTLAISILILFRFYIGESSTDLVLIVLTQLTFQSSYQMLKEKDTYHTLSFLLTLGGLILVSILMLVEYGIL